MSNLLAFLDVLSSIGGILAAILILLAMVTIHEFGHYVAGKALGFKITEFSVGFGPALFKKRSKKSGELFSLRLIPLGGYCAFDGEDESDDAYGGYYANLKKKKEESEEGGEETPAAEDAPLLKGLDAETKAEIDALFSEDVLPQEGEKMPAREGEKAEEVYPEPKGEKFVDQAPWKRIVVLVAGALMNYLLALLLTILMIGIYGAPRYEFYQDKADITQTQPYTGTLAVEDGDTLLAIDDTRLYLITDYVSALDGKKAGDTITLTLLREGGEVQTVWTIPEDISFASMTDVKPLFKALGVPSGYGYGLKGTSIQEDFWGTIGASFEYSFRLGGTVLRSLGELLTGKLGIDAMGGPVTTIGMTAEVASYGFASFLNIAALIGVNLAVFNLLPVPALDGCKVIFCLIEWIRKKPVNRKVETIIHLVGILLLFGFAIFVDIFHLF